MGLGQRVGFDASAPCGAIHPVSAVGHPDTGRVWLEVNGTVRQERDLRDLIWPIADVISHVSKAVALEPGDLIYTGTPAGVGPLAPGDRVRGGVDGVAEFDFEVGARPA